MQLLRFRRVKDGCAAVDRAALCWSLTQSSTRVLQQTPRYLQERSGACFTWDQCPSQHQEPLSALQINSSGRNWGKSILLILILLFSAILFSFLKSVYFVHLSNYCLFVCYSSVCCLYVYLSFICLSFLLSVVHLSVYLLSIISLSFVYLSFVHLLFIYLSVYHLSVFRLSTV